MLPHVRLCPSSLMPQRNRNLSEPLCGYSPKLPPVLLTILHDVHETCPQFLKWLVSPSQTQPLCASFLAQQVTLTC